MTAFVIVSALLVIAILALLLLPLLRRSQGASAAANGSELSLQVLREQVAELERERAAGRLDAASFERERMELEQRAIEDYEAAGQQTADQRRPWLAGLVALAIPLAAAGLYSLLGAPAAMTGTASQASAGNHAMNPQQLQAMTIKLAERLQQNPQDGQGWLMLARSYAMLRRFSESAAAFGRATSLLPPDAGLLADYADTLAMAQGRRLAGDPEKLIAQALAVDPNHIKALALRGSAAFERQDYRVAIADWEKILSLVPEDSGIAQGMRTSIADAQSKLGGSAGGSVAAAAGPSVAGIVSLDPSIQVSPGDAVFIFARAANGQRMPLAMVRKSAADLPSRFRLDDSLAMAPNAKLSDHKQVIIGARVSKSGDALPKPGDVEGYSEPVAVGTENVRVVIGTLVK